MYVVQYKCNRWVNCQDVNGKTKFFESVKAAREYALSGYRIAEYLGGRKYKEIEIKEDA